MNYIDRIAQRIYHRTYDPDTSPDPMDQEGWRLFRIYAVLCLATGSNTTLEGVHNAWAAWRADSDPEHRSLIPFAALSPEVQALDAPYCEAIRAVAREMGF